MTAIDSTLLQKELKRIFRYDSDSGNLIRKVVTTNSVKVGDIAGSEWKSKHTSYRRICVRGRVYYAHRLIWLYMTGELPKHEVDHIDGNGLNNKWQNLRSVTKQENMKNSKRRKDNTSGHVGISRNKRDNKWMAYISNDGKMYNLGSYSNFDDAVNSRKAAEIKYDFHPLNGTDKSATC